MTGALVWLCEYWLGSGRFTDEPGDFPGFPDARKQHEAYDADDVFEDPDGWSSDLDGDWWTLGP